MPIDAESLRKVLELEMEKGCQDSAVIGGLDGFLRRWAGQAAGSLTTPRLLSHSAQSTSPTRTRMDFSSCRYAAMLCLPLGYFPPTIFLRRSSVET